MSCRGCGRPSVHHVLDLGDIPASDIFPPVSSPEDDLCWPLTWVLCPDCLLVQLGPVSGVLPQPPTAVESVTAQRHAAESAAQVVTMLGLLPGNTVIEIDSHHGGSWLGGFEAAGLVPVHDPAAAAAASGGAGSRHTDHGAPAPAARPEFAQADLVVDVHAIAHSDELAAPLAAHRARLAPGGRLMLEFHHLLPLIEQDQIDTIRHGHYVYFSALAIERLLARHGLTVTSVRRVPMFGGSLWVVAQRADDDPVVGAEVAELLAEERAAGLDSAMALAAFGGRGRRVAEQLATHLTALAADGRTVAGYGAPSKAPVLLSLAGVGSQLLPYTVDMSPAKHGCRLPGVKVAIEPIQRLAAERPDEVVILTWDIADEIVAQLQPMMREAEWDPDFYVPLPVARYLAGPRARAAAAG